jgi:hypothetical protein
VSRILPERPSFDQLRKQARELLRACRVGDEQALKLLALRLPQTPQTPQLAHAQAALAREYGFPSWVKLRQHVEALPVAPLAPRGAARTALLVAEELLTAARERRFDQIFAGVAIPARDINVLRDLLHQRGEISILVDSLLEAAESPLDRIRFLAAQAMDHFADQRCEPVLRRLLRDSVPRVRWAALHSLQCAACKLAPLMHGEDMVETLIEMALRDPSVKVRRVATYELGQVCADPRAMAALRAITAESEDQTMLREARRALARHSSA